MTQLDFVTFLRLYQYSVYLVSSSQFCAVCLVIQLTSSVSSFLLSDKHHQNHQTEFVTRWKKEELL